MDQANVLFEQNFTDCYAKYFNIIASFVQKIVFNWDTAQELAQEVFLKIYERKDILEINSGRTTRFLQAVARNKAYDYIKRNKMKEEKYREVKLAEVSLNRGFYGDVADNYLEARIVSTMHETINSFDKEKRDIFLAKNIKREKLVNVARKSKKSAYKIRQIEDQIKTKIRENIEEYV